MISAASNAVSVKKESAVNWHRVIAFCALTYGLTWLWWIARFFPYLQPLFISGKPIERSALGPLDVQIGMFVPMLVAGIMRLWKKEGFRGSLGLRRSWKVYALAYLLPTVLGIGAICLNHLAGWARFDWAGASPLGLVPDLLLIALLAAFTALGEEYGWRGYLLPHLLSLGETKATLFVGFIWGVWHLPLLLAGLTYLGQSVLLAVPVFLLSTLLLSFLFTWFYRFSEGSVMVSALVHGALNALSELASPQHIPNGSPLVVNPFGITTGLVVFLAVVILSTFIKRDRPEESFAYSPDHE